MRVTSTNSNLRPKLLKRFLPLAMHHVGSGVSSWMLFGREILDNPRSIGAICPSSPLLARRMAGLVEPGPGKVVELGGGTGTVTSALLERGIDASQLIVIERSAKLAALLRNRFPQVTVINGDAASLAELLGTDSGEIRTIVSGLPLRSLRPKVVRNILGQAERTLQPGGLFIQFTYSHRDLRKRFSQRFNCVHSSIVWGNLPPARIDAYRIQP